MRRRKEERVLLEVPCLQDTGGGCEGSPAVPAAGASPVTSGRRRRGAAVGPVGSPSACARARGEKLEVKCLKVRSLFSMNLLYLILSTNSNLIASGLKPLQ